MLLNLQAIEEGNLDEVEETKKKVRKVGGGSGRKRPRDDISDEGGSEKKDKPKKRRGRPPVEKMSPNPPKLTRMMKKLLDIVMNYEDSDGRILGEPFTALPSRKDLPDYYEVIKKPVDFKKIKVSVGGHTVKQTGRWPVAYNPLYWFLAENLLLKKIAKSSRFLSLN